MNDDVDWSNNVTALVYEVYDYDKYKDKINNIKHNIFIKKETINQEQLCPIDRFDEAFKADAKLKIIQLHKIVIDKLNNLCKEIQDKNQNENKQDENHPFIICNSANVTYDRIDEVNEDEWKKFIRIRVTLDVCILIKHETETVDEAFLRWSNI